MAGNLFLALLSASLLVGCAAPEAQGIVMVAPDIYLLPPISNTGNLSVNGMKDVMLKKADGFCQAQGRRMQQIVNLSRENAIGSYATPEMQFKCIATRQ
ncbi:hypothetical protein Herbaro_02895 [Herbaspirillum sp. WKF16]|jgi:hypothetical protein|uniref:hypothetical protein n=1 Tax=Herbaspirillum sp. WKF16 TaxID=3028312 RepID=UPI0023A99E8F|nr:hypothetical protein [Herbaspirillum sp. WKF16]WDZ96751.1 hypothetical protein Herbaro_02895 [Herbaspirillum sp. WKF16]